MSEPIYSNDKFERILERKGRWLLQVEIRQWVTREEFSTEADALAKLKEREGDWS